MFGITPSRGGSPWPSFAIYYCTTTQILRIDKNNTTRNVPYMLSERKNTSLVNHIFYAQME